MHASCMSWHPNFTVPGLAAYDGDWRVYRFLVLVSRVMPAALRPQMPPNFQVLNPILLRVLEKWIAEGANGHPWA